MMGILSLNKIFSKKHQEHAERKTFLINDKTPFTIKEAYKSARTNIMFSLGGKGSKTIVITSAWPAEGKTTICVNLGITFSQIGAKVLLIDADLRKPRLSKIFEIKNKNGLTNVLKGFCEVKDAIHKSQFDNLDVLPSGHRPPNPAEILSSEELKELLEKLMLEYDYIIIDTPPVNVVTDAIILSSLASGIVLVARQEVTEHNLIEEALSKFKFANANVLGFILNDIKTTKHRYYKYVYRNKKGHGKYGNNYYNYLYGESASDDVENKGE